MERDFFEKYITIIDHFTIDYPRLASDKDSIDLSIFKDDPSDESDDYNDLYESQGDYDNSSVGFDDNGIMDEEFDEEYVGDGSVEECPVPIIDLASNSPLSAEECPPCYHLVTFCVTRWYSAWLVMKRFYEVLPAIRVVVNDLKQGKYSFLSDNSRKALLAVEMIEDEKLMKVVQLLWPIVEAIDYLQSNSALQIDVLPVLTSIRKTFNNVTDILPSEISSQMINQIIEKRIDLFKDVPSALRQLFYGEFLKSHGVVTVADDAVSAFLDKVQNEIYENAEYGILQYY